MSPLFIFLVQIFRYNLVHTNCVVKKLSLSVTKDVSYVTGPGRLASESEDSRAQSVSAISFFGTVARDNGVGELVV